MEVETVRSTRLIAFIFVLQDWGNLNESLDTADMTGNEIRRVIIGVGWLEGKKVIGQWHY